MGNGERPACSTCAYLKECTEVTEESIIRHGRCQLWQPAAAAELAARQDIEKDFGIWALRYAVPRLVRATHTTRRRRRPHG